MLKLYFSPMSSNSHKVLFFLHHAGIPFEPHNVELRQGEQTKPDYMQVNPFAAVPAISHDGFTLSESNTILRYLALRFEKMTAYPAALEKRVRVDQMLDYTTIHLARWIQVLNWQQVVAPLMGLPASQPLIDDARANLGKQLPKLERWLGANAAPYLCGKDLTIADAAFVPLVALARQMKVDVTPFAAVSAYADKILSTPAWTKVAEEVRAKLAAAAPKG